MRTAHIVQYDGILGTLQFLLVASDCSTLTIDASIFGYAALYMGTGRTAHCIKEQVNI